MLAEEVGYLVVVCHILLFTKVATVQLRCEDEARGIEDGRVEALQLQSSSVFNSTTRPEQARLNAARGSWCASNNDSTPYLEVDLKKKTLLCAIATQGSSELDAWVEAYEVESSTDGEAWASYTEDGTRARIFAGNSDKTTTVKQVFFQGLIAKRVRIRAKAWYGLACMRIELYGADGKTCRRSALDVGSREKFPDRRMTATSSYGKDFAPYNGRMDARTCWKPQTKSSEEYLQLDLGGVYALCGVKTQGNGNESDGEWTKMFYMTFSLDNIKTLKSMWIAGNKNPTEKLLTTSGFSGFPMAKFVRFYPTQSHRHPALRVELYGSSLGCRSSLGIESGTLDDARITANPMGTAAHNARLYGPSSGCNSSTNAGDLEVDLGGIKTVTGVAIQGDNGPGLIRVGYKKGQSQWHWIKTQAHSDSNEVLQRMAESDVRTSWFPTPIAARFIRVQAPSYPALKTGVCFRIDLYGCNHILRPRISLKSQRLIPVENSFVDVACKVSSEPPVVVKWWLGNVDVTSHSTSVQSEDLAGNVIVSSLRVNFISLEDIRNKYDCNADGTGSLQCALTFRCTAHYPDDESGTLVNKSADVYTTLSPGNITEGPHSKEKLLGESSSLKCVTYGFPAPTITWLKDGAPLKSDRFRVTNEVDKEKSTMTSVLSLSKLERGDSGIYTCRADRQLLDAPRRASANLLVLERPDPVELSLLNRATTSAHFGWMVRFEGNPPLTAFNVTLSSLTGGKETWRLPNDTLVFNATGLRPGTTYRIRIVAENKIGQSDPETENWETEETVPSPPYNIEMIPQDGEYVVSWLPPKGLYGKILNYEVYLKAKGQPASFDKKFTTTGTKTELKIKLENLNGDKAYHVSVKAKTAAGWTDASQDKAQIDTPLTAPPIPTKPAKLEKARGSTTARIRIPKFSDANGNIIYYRVLVIRIPGGTEDEAPKSSDVESKDLVSHSAAHDSRKPAAYVTFQFRGTAYDEHKIFTVGGGEESDSTHRDRRQADKYYNGPLDPGAKYIMFARAYTSKDTYSDSKEVVVDKVKVEDPVTEKKTSDRSRSVTIILIAAVIGFVVLAIIIVVIVIVFVRKRQSPSEKVVLEEKNLSQSPPREVRVEQEGLGTGTKV